MNTDPGGVRYISSRRLVRFYNLIITLNFPGSHCEIRKEPKLCFACAVFVILLVHVVKEG